jgi:protein-L-isoaspartate O-methyltransferase
MVRIRVEYARPHMHLAEAVEGADGAPVAGAGTTLTADVVRTLRRLGIATVVVREADAVADWEEEKDLERALHDLEARFASEPPDRLLDALKEALRRRLVARAREAAR